MYEFREETDPISIDNFVLSAKGNIIQTCMWAKTRLSKKPVLYSGFLNGKRVLTCVICERSSHGILLWSCVGGVCADYSDTVLIKEFTSFIKSEMKRKKISAFVSDPVVPEKINGVVQNQSVKELLKSLGYKFTENKDDFFIRYQCSCIIPFYKNNQKRSLDDIVKSFEKGIRYSVRNGAERGLVFETYTYEDIEKNPQIEKLFYEIMKETAQRADFPFPKPGFYTNFIKCFSKYAIIDFLYYDKTLDEKENEKRTLKIKELESKLNLNTKPDSFQKSEYEKLVSACKAYEKRKTASLQLPDKTYIACGLTLRFSEHATCIFGGTKNIMRNELRASHYINYKRIIDSYESGCVFHDLGNVPVNAEIPNTKYNGLYKFKKSFGADLYEYIGECVLVSNKLSFLILKLIKLKNKLLKK